MLKKLFKNASAWSALALAATGTVDAQEPIVQVAPQVIFTEAPRTPTIFGNIDYLIGWIKDASPNFPLITTGDPTNFAPGALGQPGTRVLLNGDGLELGTFSGLRGTVGWMNDSGDLGVEISAFTLFSQSEGFAANGSPAGLPPIYVPLFRAELGREGSFTIADPLLLGGIGSNINISQRSELWGMEVNAILPRVNDADGSFSWLVGFRYIDLIEDITLKTFLTEQGLTFRQQEGFNTRNQFYGFQAGFRATQNYGAFYGTLAGKLAIGPVHQVVDITGNTQQNANGVITNFRGAIFSQPTNLGRRTDDDFAVAPEVQVKVGYRFTQNLSAFVGYDFLYLSSVVRPGDNIDRVVNETQGTGGTLVGPARPVNFFNQSDFWTQAISFGVELKY